MNKKWCAVFVFIFLILGGTGHASAQEESPPLDIDTPPAQEEFFKGTVLKILSRTEDMDGMSRVIETAWVELVQPDGTKEVVEVETYDSLAPQQRIPIAIDDTVLVSRLTDEEGTHYYLIDRWRLPALAWVVAAFLALIIWLGGSKGALSFTGLGVSIFILAKGIIPLILAGHNPFLVSVGGAGIIAVLAIYLAHGFHRRTSIAVVSTLITLALTAILAHLTVLLLALSGMGTEESVFLSIDAITRINMQGLLLGGIVIGTLGVLDDITTAQAAVVDELKQANPALPVRELYRRGLSVGREHIASLVNTLVLAYAGASFPLFLLFSLNNNQPWWMVLNSEFIMEEIARTLVGSTALVLAVPITTLLAARAYGRRTNITTKIAP